MDTFLFHLEKKEGQYLVKMPYEKIDSRPRYKRNVVSKAFKSNLNDTIKCYIRML